MPIVVTVLGFIIIALGVALFTIDPKEEVKETTQVEIQSPETTAPEITEDNTPVETPAEITKDDETAAVAQAILSGTAKYNTPARVTHDIAVTFTLKDDIVNDVSVNYDNGKGPANDYQKRFESKYRAEIIGKKLNEVSLSRVGGASLTSNGFNEAVKAIKAQI
jgi:hypothetical protein